MRKRVPNRRMVSSSARVMLNHQRDISRIYVQKKAIEEGVRVEVWGTMLMALRMEARDHLGPTST